MIQFPNPEDANADGLLAHGGELSPEYLLSAYRQGIFPWFGEDEPILWYSPDPRMIVNPSDFSPSKSLRQVLNKNIFEIKIDTVFKDVISNCSCVKRSHEDETWITTDMIKAYVELHNLGYAHSFETFYNNTLVGGLYGVSLGNAFFGESMFFTKTDASKFAFYHLVQFCLNHDFVFIDTQIPTQHLASLGGKEILRSKFLNLLNKSLQHESLQGKWTKLYTPKF